MEFIKVRGASQHNLKHINLDIPRDRLVVITGVSGSGKSSLAFDTIFAEGRRRYVESLSTYARQFIGRMDKPEVESIEGLSPAIAIEQRPPSQNPRSTVGTVTEIYDYLRLLYARIGIPHCCQCGREIKPQTVEMMADHVLSYPDGTKATLLAPLVMGKKGEHQKELKKLRKDGFVRVRIDGNLFDLSEDITLDKKRRHSIDVVVDRLITKEGIGKRLRDSIEIALNLSSGLVRIDVGGNEKIFSERYACPHCGIGFSDLEPRIFSFNSPYGACPDCSGLGTRMYFDEDLIVPDPGLSIREGAMAPWERRSSVHFFQLLEALSGHYGFSIHVPYHQLSDEAKHILLYGSGSEEIQFFFDREGKRHFYSKPFEGILHTLDRRYRETASNAARSELTRYMNVRECPSCKGARLKKESLSVTLGGRNIFEVSHMSIAEATAFFEDIPLTDQELLISQSIRKEIKTRLAFLLDVGMDYLSLERPSGTLSGGEWQRIRLATQIGSGLVGVLYVLDEPTIGLHPRDDARLISTLRRLREMGNTVLVVEHDPEMMMSSDCIIDMGPGAGLQGGEIIFQGTPQEICGAQDSATGAYLSGRLKIPVPSRRRPSSGRFILLEGATENNLKNIDIKIPTGLLTCVTGVSGSGKSTMVIETLYKVMARKFYRYRGKAGKVKKVRDLGDIERVIVMDQQPIGRTPRSNPATYTGAFNIIRDLFAQLPDSRMRGYKSGRFSFNVKGGRCEACKGDGLIKIEMHFLPDVYITCDTCHGKRFTRDTLEILYKGKNIADVLDMTVSQALPFFENIPAVESKLNLLYDVGLGYIKLGQSATTLSGGEAQRIKLARELGKKVTGKTLYILDEPTIGLHFSDVQKLLDVLARLVEMGNTVVVIEHNLDVIKSADYVIDLGPEGGPGGGMIIASGTPEEVVNSESSLTGQFLRRIL
jgi:excinuclease ABC subunit A